MTESWARAQLEEMERDRLSVFVARGNLPGWYFPFLGIATATMVASHDLPQRALTIAITLIYVAAVGAALGKVLSEAPVLVRMRKLPAQLRRPLLAFTLVVAVVVAGGMIATLLYDVPWRFTHLGIVAGLVMWLGGWLTARVYDARADRLAAELGIPR